MSDDPGKSTIPFKPDWCIHPGETLRECLDEVPWCSVKMFAKVSGIPLEQLEQILGKKRSARITEDIAQRINHALSTIGGGPSAQFWRNLDKNYHDALKRGAKDITEYP